MSPYDHAISSAKIFGGEPYEYIHIHDWFDRTKAFTGDWTHRALRHHSLGVQECVDKFGHKLSLSNGTSVGIKKIAEQHVKEDCGFIPTPQDWLKIIRQNPADWMLRVGKKNNEVQFKEIK